jgi:hypothetical protein
MTPSGLCTLKIPYATWKQVCLVQILKPYHVRESANSIVAWCGSASRDIYFKASVTASEYEDWENSFSSSQEVVSDQDALAWIIGRGGSIPNKAIKIADASKISGDGSPIFASRKPDAPKLTFITPNWCDKTTWYSSSSYVEAEEAEDSGNHTTYNLGHQNIIDTYHAKISFEDFLLDSERRSYRVAVTVNDVVKIEQDPHYESGGDFTVDYAAGTITFLSALQSSDVVRVTYHYENGSTYIIKPDTGKQLMIDKVEVQCSGDIVMGDTFVFQAYGYVDVFAPQLMEPPYNIPSGTKIPLGDPLKYKTIGDLINDSNHAYPAYPILGSSNWRGLPQPAYIFSWDYDVGVTILMASYGMEIHVSLEHEAICGGAFATATFYTTSEDETAL